MAEQPLTTRDQSLATTNSNSKLEVAKRLLSPKAILPWLVTLWAVGKFVFKSLDFASVVEFAAGLGRNPNVKTVLDFILSPLGNVLTTLFGIAWLTYLVVRPRPKLSAQTSPQVPEIQILREEELKQEREQLNWESEYKEEHQAALALKRSNEDLTTQLETLRGEMSPLGEKLRQADLRINDATNQKNNWMNSCHTAERKWNDVRWFDELLIDPQSKQIQDYVAVLNVIPEHIQIDRAPRLVILKIRIRNDSVFKVSIDANGIGGTLRYKGEPLTEQIKASAETKALPPTNLEPRSTALIVLEQPLLRWEAENILEAQQTGDVNAIFCLDDVRIPITVKNIPQEVTTQNLKITAEFDLIYLADFDALKFEEENMTPRDLISAIDSFAPAERMNIYKSLLQAYSNAIMRRHEFESRLLDEGLENPEAMARRNN